jgi:hypothetical protein
VVRTTRAVEAQDIGGTRSVLVPAGTCGTVVAVFADAYEVEFQVAEGEWALSTIPAQDVLLQWKAPPREDS